MPIPDYQSIMLPLLRFAGDGNQHSLRDTIDALADQLKLSTEDKEQLLPSGRQRTFENRVGWARTYMKKAGLLESPQRGYYTITQRGRGVLEQNPSRIDAALLKQFSEFVEFQTTHRNYDDSAESGQQADMRTPEEEIEEAYQRVRQSLASELLQTITKVSPGFFEKLVIDLLVKMGYGGTRADAGEAIGRSGDSGIDGLIKEDRLGLDAVYVQAKRWDGTVSRPEIQKFAGALQGKHAHKGIFITTSNFSKEAKEYASRIESKIVLIDGDQLAQLMVDYNVGVNTIASYELKRVDLDYFTEE